ncbi:MAG: hypothetical protein HN366_08710 [Deltaproteobacteria bacterium]|jgi:hypothetical protein|nr:hypothetical protein [Deltaproteobacteria bacterium]
MTNIVIKAESAKIVITGVNFRNYAVRYHEAAKQYVAARKKTEGFDPIPYQLFCQSLELHLKSYIWIIEQYGRNKFINKYGHDIVKLWYHSKSRGIQKYVSITPLRDSVIDLVGPYYKQRKFCYLDIDMIFNGYKELKTEPKVLQTLSRLTSQLGKSIRRPLNDASQPT